MQSGGSAVSGAGTEMSPGTGDAPREVLQLMARTLHAVPYSRFSTPRFVLDIARPVCSKSLRGIVISSVG